MLLAASGARPVEELAGLARHTPRRADFPAIAFPLMPFTALTPIHILPDELLPTLLAGPPLAMCRLKSVSADDDDPERHDFTIEHLNPAMPRQPWCSKYRIMFWD